MVYLLRNRVATDIESHLYAVVGTTSLGNEKEIKAGP